MPRTASAAMVAALQASILCPAIFVEANFANGPVYVWSGYGSVTWNGQTWQGLGSLGSISNIEEGATVEAKGMTLTVSGVDPALLSDVLTDFQVGLPVTVWLGLFDASGSLLADPIVSFAGRMDQPTISMSGEIATIGINCESRLLDMNVSVERRYTDADQQLDYPGDLGFGFVNSIQDVTIYWGRHPSSLNNFAVQGHSS